MKQILLISLKMCFVAVAFGNPSSDSLHLNFEEFIQFSQKNNDQDTEMNSVIRTFKESALQINVNKIFEEYPEIYLNYTYRGRKYSINQIKQLAEARIIDFSKEVPFIKNKNWYDYEYLRSNELFRLVQEIDKLPANKQEYFKSVGSIEKRINTLSPIDKVYAVVYFNRHFVQAFDSIDLVLVAKQQCYLIAYSQVDPFVQAKCFVTLGDCLSEFDKLPAVIQPYYRAHFIYDSLNANRELAHVKVRLGLLYAEVKDNFYLNKANKFYTQAGSLFIKSEDTSSYFVCHLNAAWNNILSNVYDSTFGDNYLLTNIYHFGRYNGIIDSKDTGLVHSDHKLMFFNVLGSYYGSYYDSLRRKLALTYYHAALIESINNYDNCSMDQVYRALTNLSYTYSISQSREWAIKYIGIAIHFSQLRFDSVRTQKLFLEKANIYGNLGESKNAIYWAKKAIDIPENVRIFYKDWHLLHKSTYDLLRQMYSNLQKTDSANYFHLLYQNELSLEVMDAQMVTDIESYWRNSESANQIAKTEKTILQIIIWGSSAFIATLLLLWALYKIRIKRKTDRENYEKSLLSSAAKAKLHNVRNNYNSISNLIDRNEYQVAKEYVERSAFYYSNTLDIGDDSLWTVSSEWELLNDYNFAESLKGRNVSISKDFEGFNPNITFFMQDVFTTLLHNSIEHGFKDKITDNTVLIRIIRKGNILILEFIDNGTADDIYNYTSKVNSGLNILKERVVNKLKYAGLKNEIETCFEVVVNEVTKGTIVKIKYPYEVST